MRNDDDSGELLWGDTLGRLAVEAASDVVLSVSQEGAILYVNEAVHRVFGRSPSEVVGRSFAEFLAEPDRSTYSQAFRDYIATGERTLESWRRLPLKGVDREGRELSLEVSFGEFTHDSKRFFTAVVRDVADREDRRRYRELVEESLGLMCCHDLDGALLAVNAPAAEALGYQPHEMVGHRLQDFMPPEVHNGVADYLAALNEGSTETGLARFLRRDGRELTWHFQNVVCRDADGTPYVVGHALDVTRQLQAQETMREGEERLRVLVEQMPAVMWTTDDRLRFTSWQGAGLAALGVEPGRTNGVTVQEFFDSDDPEIAPVAAHRRALEGASADYDVEIEGLTYQSHIEPLRDADGKIVGVIGVARDITARRTAERETRRALSLLSATLESTADGLLVVDLEGRITSYNRKFAEMWSIPDEVLHTGADASALEHVLDQLVDPDKFMSRVKALYEHPETESFDVLDFKDGRTFERYSQPQTIDAEIVGRVWSFRDVSERKRAEERIEHQAYHDTLTGLPNRLLVKDRLEMALAGAGRHGKLVAVLFLDLDDFKLVNDTFGHSIGDELLRVVAERLRAELRGGDTLGRLGGDEFTAVLTDLDRGSDAEMLAERLRAAFDRPFSLSSATVPMSVSIGVSTSELAGDDLEFLMQSADAAMYVAKERGGNAVRIANRELNLTTWRRASLVSRLRQALDNEEFDVHYQPIVGLPAQAIVGMEALVRWRDPEEGLTGPPDFLRVAEQSHLIVPIDDWVLHSACEQAREWQQLHRGLRVAVNLSLRQFQHPDLVAKVASALSDTGLDADLLELEIAESIAMADAEHAIRALMHLRELGVRISIDDFGTGQTSLSYLRKLPIDTLKIDRALVCDVAESSQAAVIVSAILQMAHGLGLEAVGEGVETEEQRAFLLQKGCAKAQGFLFSEPLASSQMRARLEGGIV